jgi:hypothetical protein
MKKIHRFNMLNIFILLVISLFAINYTYAVCGDRITDISAGEKCDWGLAAQDFTNVTIINPVTGTAYPMCNGGGGANIFCQDKGYDKASGDSPSNAIPSNKCVYPATTGMTGTNYFIVTGSHALGGKWYIGNASINTLPPIHCMYYSAVPVNGAVCTPSAYGVPCTYCNSTCGNVTIVQHCGDGIVTSPPEQCDGINLSGTSCASLGLADNPTSVNKGLKCNISSCNFDLSGCSTFPSGQLPGWNLLGGTAWTITSYGALSVTMPGSAVSTFSFDLKTGVNYGLNYITTKDNAACTVTFDLNDNNCTSFSTFTTKNCFDVGQVFSDTSGSPDTRLVSYNFNLLNNGNATDGLFKDVKLRITVSESVRGACNSVLIQNISLKETTNVDNGIYYDASQLAGVGTSASGCCPANYCWDGTQCWNSDYWMNDSSKAPLWSSISGDSIFGHINTTDQDIARGYRCIITNYTSRTAQWVLSDIKYDWNYKNSGYCARSTDCFVDSNNFDNVNINYSKGCVLDGDIISDSYELNAGNHYCHQGQWTTKSYIVATTLQNISAKLGNDYILQCYDNYSMNYNIPEPVSNLPWYDTSLLASCVMIMQTPPTEQIITGVILNDTKDNNLADDFITALESNYITNRVNSNVAVGTCTDMAPVLIPNSNFSLCLSATNLYVYYETNYKYFIISDKPISGITTPTFWDVIVGFFQKLFGSKNGGPIQPYDVINYSTNYDNIYIMRNGTVNVTAIEELKYDELNQSMVNILYIRYSGSNDTTNYINRDDLFNKINDTMSSSQQDAVVVNMSYVSSPTEQEIILRSQNKSGLWPYMTTILRIRP